MPILGPICAVIRQDPHRSSALPPVSDRCLALIAVVGLSAAALGGIAAYFTSPFLNYAARVEQSAPTVADPQVSRAVKADRPATRSDSNAAAVRDFDVSAAAMISPTGAALIVASPMPPS